MIDMHAHWRPAELADEMRARTAEPRIVKNDAGVEVLKTRMGEEPLATAFDEVDFHLARMDRQGVSTSALSLVGSFCWIESQPLEVSRRLCGLFNDGISRIFGPRAIEAAVRLYGADRIVCGTDGTEFGCEWTNKALSDAQIGEEAREKILHGNAAAMLSSLAPIAPCVPAAT